MAGTTLESLRDKVWPGRLLLLAVLGMAAALRLSGIAWDGYEHYHPDERYIAWVAASIEPPASWADAFRPHRSTFNPYYWPAGVTSPGVVLPQDEPRRFAYGHLPLYAGVLATRLAERAGQALGDRLPATGFLAGDLLNGAGRTEFDHLLVVGRLLTAAVDLGSVVLLFLLGRRLAGFAAGLLAAAFLGLNVMHVQLAHFWTADPFLTFFALLALVAMIRSLEAPRWLALAGAATGLAVGSKFAGVFLVLPLAAAFALGPRPRRARRLLAALLAALAAFALTNPFALLDFTCDVTLPAFGLGPLSMPAWNVGSCFVENVARQSAMVGGRLDLAFARQYAGTTPYLYFLEMQFKWGMGPLLALAAFAGLGWMLWRLGRERIRLPAGLVVLLAWVAPFFLFTGGLTVKFMRYLQPITPPLMLLAAMALLAISRRAWRAAGVGLTLLATAAYALAFVNLYGQTHPWLATSAWIFANVPAGATIVTEQWDDPLPSSIEVDGAFLSARRYASRELTWLTGTGTGDDRAKLEANLNRLAEGDFLVIASNRIYGVVPRLPARYPLSSQAHALLFAGELGYDVVFVADRGPHLGAWRLRPDTFSWPGLTPPPAVTAHLAQKPTLNAGRADESFTVYDQALTIVLANTGRLSPEEMLARFDLAPAEGTHEP